MELKNCFLHKTWKMAENKLEPGTDCNAQNLELIANGAINRPASRNRLHSTKWKAWQTKTNSKENIFLLKLFWD